MSKEIVAEEPIRIKNASLHNLKNISLNLPKNQLVVITGVSGSGKSTLAFDTVYAEGQRRYVESLSAYTRQFLGKIEKPQVDDIKGLAPAIAIQQKVISSNPRSTVGTTTEIYDYLKILFARVGKTISPVSGKEVKKDQVEDVIRYVKTFRNGDKYLVLAPIRNWQEEGFEKTLEKLKLLGFVRVEIEGNITTIEDLESFGFQAQEDMQINLVVERNEFFADANESYFQRLADSVETAFYEGKGVCIIKNISSASTEEFSNQFELDGITFLEPTPQFFSFNNPYGACPKCEGFGKVVGIDPDLVVPNKSLSIYDDAVVAWKGDKMSEWKNHLIKAASAFDFPIHKPYYELSEKNLQDLWQGNEYFPGIDGFFQMVESNSYKIQYRVMLSRYRGKTKCNLCNGKRLRQETENVKLNGYTLMSWVDLPVDQLLELVQKLSLNETEEKIAKQILIEVKSRLHYLQQVGLGYLTLNRASNTLSGGESQRLNLSTSLGSSLVGSIYILDEPSIGLHSKDTEKLIQILHQLKEKDNTVIVVEHDEEMMNEADHIVDMGPLAGHFGGEVVFEGNYEKMMKSDSLTAQYLNGEREIKIPEPKRKITNFIKVKGARQYNLKNIEVQLPLQGFGVITGVSGSGKSTLIRDIVVPSVERKLDIFGNKVGEVDSVTFPEDIIHHIEWVNQNPIGKSSRSNPATYVKAYDDIRQLYAHQKASKMMNLKPKHFSFNVDGGRCDKCLGEGYVTIEMQFMADIELSCEVCHGHRFKKEILEIQYQEKNIADILEMTIDEAIDFFLTYKEEKIVQKLLPLRQVGLGYLHMGQSSNTLSGGESQRIKLASFLAKGESKEKTLFIFDEPSTGLHFYDIDKLLKAFYALIEKGHSILVIEHHLDIIKCADYMVEMGPGAGVNGGNVIYEGTPEKSVKDKNSVIGPYLAPKFKQVQR